MVIALYFVFNVTSPSWRSTYAHAQKTISPKPTGKLLQLWRATCKFCGFPLSLVELLLKTHTHLTKYMYTSSETKAHTL